MVLVGASVVGTFVWDRLVVAIFAQPIFNAMLVSAKKTTIKDLLPIFTTVGKVAGGLLLLGTGNPLLWMGAYWAYRKFRTSE